MRDPQLKLRVGARPAQLGTATAPRRACPPRVLLSVTLSAGPIDGFDGTTFNTIVNENCAINVTSRPTSTARSSTPFAAAFRVQTTSPNSVRVVANDIDVDGVMNTSLTSPAAVHGWRGRRRAGAQPGGCGRLGRGWAGSAALDRPWPCRRAGVDSSFSWRSVTKQRAVAAQLVAHPGAGDDDVQALPWQLMRKRSLSAAGSNCWRELRLAAVDGRPAERATAADPRARERRRCAGPSPVLCSRSPRSISAASPK